MIRPATVGDAVPIAELAGQLGYPTRGDEMRDRVERVLAGERHRLWVYEESGAVVAWMQVSVRVLIESPPYAEIVGLVVAEDRRGRGIGTALVGKAEDWARAQGLAAVRVRSNVVREAAHRFYLRHGFREAKRQAVFVKGL